MSFSPEIESSHMQIMNVFTRYNGGEPFKSYDQFLAANFIPSPVNFRSTPLRFPTLYSFGNGNDVPYAEAIRSIDADYLVYCIRGTVTELPNLPSAADRSGFLAWDEGFLSTLMSRVWAYRNGAAGVDDEWIQEYKLGDTSDNWYYSNSERTIPGSRMVDFYKNDWAAAPFNVYFTEIKYAAGVTERVQLNFTDRRTQLGITQVLYSTSVADASGDNSFAKDEDGEWALPSEMTVVQKEQYKYPRPGSPYPVEGGTAGDVELYNSNFSHNYDSGYDYVRQSLKSTFKTPDQIASNSENYIDSIVEGINELLSVTSEVPRGFTTRKQASPQALRENYTTFSQLNIESASPNTTSPSTTINMPTAGVGGGGSSY